MPVRIDINPSEIAHNIDKLWGKGLAELTSQVLADCNKYCKEDTSTLIMSSLIHSELDKGLCIWQTPYAARQYYEIKTAHTDVNPNASWRWADVAKKNHFPKWERQAQALMRLYHE